MTKLIKAYLGNYGSRHKNGVNGVLHVIGIPLAVSGIFLIFTELWKFGFLSIFTGYLLQWVGHTYFEKNEVGEWTLIKNIVNRLKRG